MTKCKMIIEIMGRYIQYSQDENFITFEARLCKKDPILKTSQKDPYCSRLSQSAMKQNCEALFFFCTMLQRIPVPKHVPLSGLFRK